MRHTPRTMPTWRPRDAFDRSSRRRGEQTTRRSSSQRLGKRRIGCGHDGCAGRSMHPSTSPCARSTSEAQSSDTGRRRTQMMRRRKRAARTMYLSRRKQHRRYARPVIEVEPVRPGLHVVLRQCAALKPQALTSVTISPASSVESIPQSINPYMVAVTSRGSTFPTSLHVGISPPASSSSTGGTPDSFDDVTGALDNECTPARESQHLTDVGLGPCFSIPRGASALSSPPQLTCGCRGAVRRRVASVELRTRGDVCAYDSGGLRGVQRTAPGLGSALDALAAERRPGGDEPMELPWHTHTKGHYR
jgi:hypothetical protein